MLKGDEKRKSSRPVSRVLYLVWNEVLAIYPDLASP